MVNYLKVIRRAILGKATAQSIDSLPQAADMVTLTANAADWNITGTAVTLGTVNATYPCGVAAVVLNNFSDIAASWEAEVIIRTVSGTGQILARVPFSGNVNVTSAVGESAISQMVVNLPKMPVVGPGIELFATLATADAVGDTADVKVILAIDV